MVMILQMLMTITMLTAMMLMNMIAVKTIKWAFACSGNAPPLNFCCSRVAFKLYCALLHLQVLFL